MIAGSIGTPIRIQNSNTVWARGRARQNGVVTSSATILVIAWFSVHWNGSSNSGQLLGVGFLWLALILALEVAFGRLVLRAS